MAFYDALQWHGEMKWARRYNSKNRKRRIVTEAKRQTRRLRRREWKWKGKADEDS